MKLPFVILPRGVYEDLLKSQEFERTRAGKLTRTLVRMKVNGAILPRSALAARGGQLPPRAVDRLQDIVDSNKHAKANPAVKRALQTYLDTARANHADESDIERRLRTWHVPRDTDDDAVDDDLIEVLVD